MVAKVVKQKLEEDGQSAFYWSLQLAGLDAKPRRSVEWAYEDNDRLYVTIWDTTTSEKNGDVQSIIPAGKWIRNARSHTKPKAQRMLDALLRYEGKDVVAILCERDKNSDEVKIRMQNGKEILLFEALGKSKPVRYVGMWSKNSSVLRYQHLGI